MYGVLWCGQMRTDVASLGTLLDSDEARGIGGLSGGEKSYATLVCALC